ncbi:MAG: universal stress protein [Acidobacteriota bacterium]
MFESVLYTTDGSELAARSLPLALGLAEQEGARLRIVTCVNTVDAVIFPGTAATTGSDLYQSLKEELDKAAEATLDRAAREAEDAGVECSVALRHGHPAEEILAEARSWGADVIVMSTHGRTGMPRLLMGSIANQVLHRSTLPVLLRPEHEGRG